MNESSASTEQKPVNFIRGTGVRGVAPGTPEARGSNVKLRCGDCLHYKGTAHPAIGKPCIQNGATAGATAPSCYTADLHVFRDFAPESFAIMISMVVGMTTQQQRVFMGLMRTASNLERSGLSFGQTVYFCTVKGDTLSDYYRGFVCSRGPNQTIMVVGLPYMKGARATCVALLDSASLLSKKKFLKAKNALINKGALSSLPPRKQAAVLKDSYEPPTLDTATEFLDQQALKTKKKHGSAVRADREKVWVIDQASAEKQDAEVGDGL